MSECSHDCSSCGQSCSERKAPDLHAKPHAQSSVKKVAGRLGAAVRLAQPKNISL